MKVAAIVLALAACAAAASYRNPSSGYGKDSYDYAPASYSFDYAVRDDHSYVNMGHNEDRQGDNTKGSYFVDLSDGRRQIVNYYVNGYSGYIADVQYEGEAKYADDYKHGNAYNARPVHKSSYPRNNYAKHY